MCSSIVLQMLISGTLFSLFSLEHGLTFSSLQIPEAKAKPASHGFDWVIKITFGGVHSAILASSGPFGLH
jgi:hypothetical protein